MDIATEQGIRVIAIVAVIVGLILFVGGPFLMMGMVKRAKERQEEKERAAGTRDSRQP